MGRGLSAQQKRILSMLEFTERKDDPEDGWFSTQEIISELHPEYGLWLNSWRSEMFSKGPWSSERARPHESKRVSVSRALRSLEKRGLVVSHMGQRHSRFWTIPKRVNRTRDFYGSIVDEMSWVDKSEAREFRRKVWSWAWYKRRLGAITLTHLRLGLYHLIDPKELEKIHQDYKDFWKRPFFYSDW